MMLLKQIFSIAFFTLLHGALFAQGFLKTDGKRIVNDKGENVLLRGMGLGGWMLQEGYMLRIYNEGQQYRIRERLEKLTSPEQVKDFYGTWLANHTTKADIDSLKSWGFNSVRLPMHYNLYTLPVEKEPVAGEHTWLNKGFDLTDSLLAWCKANKLYLILDLHAAPGGQGTDMNISDRDPGKPSLWQSDANKQKTIALWKKLAEKYANEPWIGAYDIINEPNWGFQDTVNDKNGLKDELNAPLKQLMVDITKAIRQVDKNHIIIIEGNGWGNNYNGMLPPWDNNMVLSFHKYWNRNTENEIKRMLDAREQHNVPVWLGETGENSNVWFTQAIQLLERNNIGWAWWPLKKAGVSNPLEIFANHNWMQVADYFNGNRENPPKESDVYSGMFELAAYSKLEYCRFHPDVIDAMFRQVGSAEAIPFKKHSIGNNLVIEAVDYDLGRNGSAYYDRDTLNYGDEKNNAGNRGNTYRNDGVDIRKDSAHYEQYYVSDTEEGEWLQYTLNAARPGTYSIDIVTAAENEGGVLSLMINNKTVAQNMKVPVTNGNKNWKTTTIKNVLVRPGKTRLKVAILKGGFNLKQIIIRK